MSWKGEAVNLYFQTPKEGLSYIHFLNVTKQTILQNVTSKDDFQLLNGQLYGMFKCLLPKDAPRTSLKRQEAISFWDKVSKECAIREQANTVTENFRLSSLHLLDTAREVSVSRIEKRLHQEIHENEPPASPEASTNLDVENPFMDRTSSERVRSRILEFRSRAQHESELHKQDLLYYGIIDEVPSSSTKLKDIFEESDLEDIRKQTEKVFSSARATRGSDCVTHKKVKEFATDVLAPVNDQTQLREAIKAARQRVRENRDQDATWKRTLLRLMKQMRDVYTDGQCTLNQKQGEWHYICTFLSPLFKELLKEYADNIKIECFRGSQSLQPDREERRMAQKDNERRDPGKTPDAIFSLKEFNLPFALMEVSGPPNQHHHQHFVGDRIKLGKQLKTTLKWIRGIITSGDEGLYEQIKLYGIQVYLNQMYVYSLCQPSKGIYVFQREQWFDLASPAGLLSSSLPRLLKNLWKVKGSIANSVLSINDFLNSDINFDSSDLSDDSRDSVHASPKKQKTRN